MLRLIFDWGGDSSGINLYAACLHRAAAFWKDATMAKALQLLGFVNLKDIANACIYLLSDASRWVTGSNLVVDGGVYYEMMFFGNKSYINLFLFFWWPVLIGRPLIDVEDGLVDGFEDLWGEEVWRRRGSFHFVIECDG